MTASIRGPFKSPIPFGRFLVVIFIGMTFTSNTSADELSSVITAWKGREASVKSLQFSWSGTEFQAKGTKRGAPSRRSEKGATLPEDYSFDYGMSYSIDGQGRIRREYQGKAWSIDKVAHVPKTVISSPLFQ